MKKFQIKTIPLDATDLQKINTAYDTDLNAVYNAFAGNKKEETWYPQSRGSRG